MNARTNYAVSMEGIQEFSFPLNLEYSLLGIEEFTIITSAPVETFDPQQNLMDTVHRITSNAKQDDDTLYAAAAAIQRIKGRPAGTTEEWAERLSGSLFSDLDKRR